MVPQNIATSWSPEPVTITLYDKKKRLCDYELRILT